MTNVDLCASPGAPTGVRRRRRAPEPGKPKEPEKARPNSGLVREGRADAALDAALDQLSPAGAPQGSMSGLGRRGAPEPGRIGV